MSKESKKILKSCANSLPGLSPLNLIDYTKSQNPYQARFSDEWEEAIAELTAMSPFVTINTVFLQIILTI